LRNINISILLLINLSSNAIELINNVLKLVKHLDNNDDDIIIDAYAILRLLAKELETRDILKDNN